MVARPAPPDPTPRDARPGWLPRIRPGPYPSSRHLRLSLWPTQRHAHPVDEPGHRLLALESLRDSTASTHVGPRPRRAATAAHDDLWRTRARCRCVRVSSMATPEHDRAHGGRDGRDGRLDGAGRNDPRRGEVVPHGSVRRGSPWTRAPDQADPRRLPARPRGHPRRVAVGRRALGDGADQPTGLGDRRAAGTREAPRHDPRRRDWRGGGADARRRRAGSRRASLSRARRSDRAGLVVSPWRGVDDRHLPLAGPFTGAARLPGSGSAPRPACA